MANLETLTPLTTTTAKAIQTAHNWTDDILQPWMGYFDRGAASSKRGRSIGIFAAETAGGDLLEIFAKDDVITRWINEIREARKDARDEGASKADLEALRCEEIVAVSIRATFTDCVLVHLGDARDAFFARRGASLVPPGAVAP